MSEQETTLQEVDRWKALNNVESISVRHGSGSWTVVIKGGSVNYTAISKRLQVAWETAKAALKDLVPEDKKRAFGHGVEITVNAGGAKTVKVLG